MRYKILTVDDSKTVRIIVKKAFKTFDCEILEAANGVEGLAGASKENPDLILLDITMPRLSGEETAALLREVRRDVRILFISGYNRRELVDTMEGHDRISFLQKPFALDALRKELTVLLN